MGMGYGAAFAEVIEEKAIKRTCPEEFKALTKALKKYEVSLEDLNRAIEDQEPLVGRDQDDDEAVEKELKGLLKNLQVAFKKKSGGLDLALGFHNSDDCGSSYDEVDGLYWWVDGMYQLTAAGKRFKKDVTRKFFVQFG